MIGAGFDLRTEVSNLADRIVGPVAAKLAQKELGAALGEICNAFWQLSTTSTPPRLDFERMAVNILEPLKAKLSEAELARIVDRLRGAMAGFSQRDDAKAQIDAELSGIQQVEQHAQSEADPEPWWWNTSEETMWLLILLWLCTEVRWQLQ